MRRLGVILLIIAGLYFAHPLYLGWLAGFLNAADKLERADVILVLSGDSNGERVAEGAKLYQEGFAPYLLMSGGPLAWRLSYADWMKKEAMAMGVPAGVILLEGGSRSTIENAVFSLKIVRDRGFKTVILVTSPYHTRRAGGVFKKVFSPAGIRVLVHPVAKSEFNPDRWWTRHEDTAFVAWEYVSLVLYLVKGYN